MNEITPRYIEWLWKPFLQARALNVMTGDPGVGKSTVVCDIVSRLSRGDPLPGSSLRLDPVNSWILNAEDAADDTIVWRLMNQGADPARVHITDQGCELDAAAVHLMEERIADLKIGLVVIDPLQAWMGTGVDMHRANDTRQWAGHLRNMAMRQNCTIIFVRHRRKSAAGDNRLYSGMGSIDITGFARSEVSLSRSKDDKHCVLSRSKGNVGPDNEKIRYHIIASDNDHGRLEWLDDATYVENPPALVGCGTPNPRAPSRVPRVSLARVTPWLLKQLHTGPVPATLLAQQASVIGISRSTLYRAKIELGITSTGPKGAEVWSIQQLLAPPTAAV